MDMEVIKEIQAGKNNWNTFQVGVKDGNVFIRDESGYIDFSDDEIDDLIRGIDQARRRVRELERIPTGDNSGDHIDETMEREQEPEQEEPEPEEESGKGPGEEFEEPEASGRGVSKEV